MNVANWPLVPIYSMEKTTSDPILWVERYADRLYAYALKYIFDEELAKDLVQETFLAALQAREGFKAQSSELTWLTGILKHKIADTFRKKKRRPEELNGDDFFDEVGHWKTKPLAIGTDEGNPLENKELGRMLEKCMAKLPAQWLAVFNLKYLEESTTELICSSLGITASNFWVIVHRSKLNLRACLHKHWL